MIKRNFEGFNMSCLCILNAAITHPIFHSISVFLTTQQTHFLKLQNEASNGYAGIITIVLFELVGAKFSVIVRRQNQAPELLLFHSVFYKESLLSSFSWALILDPDKYKWFLP